MNIHHLELFYYVARHGGISPAVRHMPYGIQQPAVSSQILLLEQGLGVKLFDRRPFRLTGEGKELFAFVRPFFDNLDVMTTQLRQQKAPQLRIGASEMVLRNHLPQVLRSLRQRHPQLRLGLRSGLQAQMESWLQEGQIDLAVTALESRPGSRLHLVHLLQLPLVLLVHKKSKIKSAVELWRQDRIEEPLISLPATEVLSQLFQTGLKRHKTDWLPTIEAGSLELITWYVANGYGIGVNVHLPELVTHPKVRVLPLEGFAPYEVVVMCRGKPTPFLQLVLEEIQRYVREAGVGFGLKG